MATMTQEEINALQEEVGRRIAKVMYVNTTCSIAFAGVQFFMCSYIVLSYLESSKSERRGRLPYIIASVLIFVLFALMASLDSFFVFDIAFEATSGFAFNTLFYFNDLGWARKTSVWAMTFYVAIADSVLVYRSYMIWKDKWWVCIPNVLALLLATSFAIAAASLPERSQYTNALNSGWTISSAVVNILTTGTIAFRLIRANYRLQRAMPGRTGKFLSDVVTMIVESALPPAIFGILFAAFSVNGNVGDTVESATRFYATYFIFSLFFYGFVALSPQLIIFRVTTGRSWARASPATSEKSGSTGGVSNPLHFAHSAHIDTIFLTQGEYHNDSNDAGNGSDPSLEREREKEKDDAARHQV